MCSFAGPLRCLTTAATASRYAQPAADCARYEMERTQLFDLMGELKLWGMKAAFDEIMATAIKRQHDPQRIVGDLLNAEINEKQARSIMRVNSLSLIDDVEQACKAVLDGEQFNASRIATARRCPTHTCERNLPRTTL
jgi:hypothetical protein